MDMNLEDFTFESLNSLKFNELLKLSSQHKVFKRRAKKHEIINTLLALKSEKNYSKEIVDVEWRDASKILTELKEESTPEIDDRRLTFNIESNDNSRLTFNVESKDLQNPIICRKSRLTYEIPPSQNEFSESRATYEVSQNGQSLLEKESPESKEHSKIIEPNSPIACDNIEKLGSISENFERRLTFNITKEVKPENPEVIKPKIQIKMLTIPLTRIPKRGESQKFFKNKTDSSLKMSKKSINIKKGGKSEILKSPCAMRSVRENPLMGKILSSKKTGLLQGTNEKSTKPPVVQSNYKGKTLSNVDINKENILGSSRRRKSKTEDNSLVKKPNPIKVNFLTPPTASRLKRESIREADKTNLSLTSRIPKAKFGGGNSSIITTKPITATKMPDFASIHKKQFEQMDSLHDYQRKKAERARKLFGTPQPGVPKVMKNEIPKPSKAVFQFKSINSEKTTSNFMKSVYKERKNVSPVKSKVVQQKNTQKESMKQRIPLRTNNEIKDKNRSRLHGVRTNKRFELQMKFRNVQV